MRDLTLLFDRHRNNIFLATKERQYTYGEFYKHCCALSATLKNLKLEMHDITLRPDNSFNTLALIFSLASMGIKPSLISRRQKNTAVFFDREKIIKINSEVNFNNIQDISFPLESELIFWTSGTSSTPKGAVLNFGNFYFNALGANENIPFLQNDQWFLTLPLEHVGGLSIIFRALVGGGTVILSEPGESDLPTELTHLSFVSTQLYRYLKNPKPLKSLKALVLGGSAMPWQLVEKSLSLGMKVYKSYGMTEMASQITTTKTLKIEELKTSGQILDHRQIKIHKEQIYLRGPCLFKGYVKAGGVTSPFDSEGWFKTSDRGEWTKEGYLNVLGRSDRVFISAGENIQPESIERVLLEYPGVLKARVIPQRDEEYGFYPLAFIGHEDELDLNHIKIFLKARLTGLQVPRHILEWSSMPEEHKTAKDL